MDREIKFRCWIKPYYKFDKCKKDYRMVYPHLEKDEWYVIDCQSQTLMDGEGGKISDYKMYLQQFTGLKDKNGKEIYEGDVVKSDVGLCEVEWIGSGLSLHTLPRESSRSIFSVNYHECEVIGNIFENPELIK